MRRSRWRCSLKPKRLKYTPKEGVVVIGWRPGEVREVPAAEAKRLLATGAFEIVKPDKEGK